MNNRNKRIKVYTIVLIVLLVLGVALVGLSFAAAAYIEPLKAAALYFAIGGGVLLVAALVICVLRLIEINQKRKQTEADAWEIEEALLRLSYGESVNLNAFSLDPNLAIAKGAINDAAMVRRKPIPVPSVLKEEVFDDAVLRILLKEPTPLASLTYFRLTCDLPFEEEGPLDALLTMLRTNYGENVYYGEIDGGYAVFIPYAYSRSECVGKARRTVQLYSYSQGQAKIQTKASTAFYPDYAPRNLTSEAIKGLASTDAMEVKVLSNVMDRFGYPAAEEVNAITALDTAKKATEDAVTIEAVWDAVVESSEKVLGYLGFEVLGLALYQESKDEYKLKEAALPGHEVLQRVARNGILPSSTLDPFYSLARDEGGRILAMDPLYLGSKPRSILDSFGLSNAFFEAVFEGERKLGVVYIARQEKGAMDRKLYDFMRSYSAILSYALRKIVFLEDQKKAMIRSSSAYASLNGYGYAVDEDNMKLTYLSPNLQKALPSAKVGIKCHKALYGSDSPCARCPLRERLIEKSIPKLGSGTYALTARPGYQETEVYIASRKEDFASIRIDDATGLYNDRALHEDLQKEILIKEAEGYILGFRIRNAPSLIRQYRLEEDDYTPILAPVAKALSAASLDGSLYRNGEYGFAYLLPALTHKEAEDLASKVAKALRSKLPLDDKFFEATLDFALMSYPLEASNPFDMDSLFRVLYEKADASSKGRMFENGYDQGRIADQMTYVSAKMEEYLRGGAMPLRYGVYKENVGKRIAYLVAEPALTEEDGRKVSLEDAMDLIDASGKTREEKECELVSIAAMLAEHKQEIPSSSLLGTIISADFSCFDIGFIQRVVEVFRKKKVTRKNLIIEVSELDYKQRKEQFVKFAEAAKRKGIALGLRGYNADLGEEELKPFSYVRFASSNVYGESRDRFVTGLSSARALGLSFLVDDVSSKEEAHYLGSLSLHYGRGINDEAIENEQIGELLK